MQKLPRIVLYILIAVSLVLTGLFFFGGSVESAGGVYEPTFTGEFLTWGYILFFAAVAITILFSLFHIATHPKALKGALITLVVGAVLVFAAYMLASDELQSGLPENTTAETLKWSGTILWTTWILGGIAIVSIFVSEIYRAIKS